MDVERTEFVPLYRNPWLVRALLLLVFFSLLAGWLLNTPEGALGKADALGYAVCHRIDARSFHLADGRALPLCVRCSGMYLGAMLGLAFQFAFSGRRRGFPPIWALAVMGLWFLAFAIDGSNSYLTLFLGSGLLYEPTHELRLLTGAGMGLALALILFPAFNDTVWADSQPGPALSNWRSLLVLTLLGLGLAALVETEHWLVLYVLAWVSAGGILVMLTMIYLLVVLMLLRQSGQIQSWRQLAWPGLAALTLALLQVAALNWMRFALTGTWSGFLFS